MGVGIMQKLLQIYAGTAISRARIQLQASVGAAVTGECQAAADAAVVAEEISDTAASALLEKLLRVDTDAWETEVKNGINGDLSKELLVSEVQKTMASDL